MRRLALFVAGATLMVGCGSNATTVDYTEFCRVAASMETAADEPHGENPAGVTDPEVMRDTWTKAAALADELRDTSPDAIKDDVELLASSVIDTNELFRAHDYDLVAIAKDENLRKEFDAINQREGSADASTRFNKFVKEKCPAT